MKEQSLPGGDLEYAVLASLWDAGRASARELHDRVGAAKGLAYTTIAKVLDRLHVKGLVSRRMSGRAFVYVAKVPRVTIDEARAKRAVLRLLGDAPRPAMAALVDAVDALDPQLLEELERLVADRRKRGRRGP